MGEAGFEIGVHRQVRGEDEALEMRQDIVALDTVFGSGMRDSTARKIEAAMETIAREVAENEGLTPTTRGR